MVWLQASHSGAASLHNLRIRDEDASWPVFVEPVLWE